MANMLGDACSLSGANVSNEKILASRENKQKTIRVCQWRRRLDSLDMWTGVLNNKQHLFLTNFKKINIKKKFGRVIFVGPQDKCF